MPSPVLTSKQRRQLRGLGHHIKPTVQIGRQGVTEAVVAQVDRALLDHELIKVKVLDGAMQTPDESAKMLVEQTSAVLIQRLGHVVTLYRPDPEAPRIQLVKAAKEKRKHTS